MHRHRAPMLRHFSPSHRLFPLLLFVGAFLLTLLFAKAPSMGDDIDYYGFAVGLRYPQPALEISDGFHFLRWPVWGTIGLIQYLSGPGLASFLFVPRFCIALSTALLFALGRRVAGPLAGGLAAALFFFHPLVDPLLERPMPDVVEGLLGLLGFLVVWWRLRAAEEGRPPRALATWATGFALGVLIFTTWANRPTGLVWVIVVFLLALTRIRLMAPVIALAVPVAGGLFCLEGLIYQRVFGDFWHSITANLGATDRKGTEAISIFELPFRFLDTLIDRRMSLVLLLLAVAGAVWLSTRERRRLSHWWLIGWGALSYLGLACAIQSVSPLQPLVRDGKRFIGTVAFPISLLAAFGIYWAVPFIARKWPRTRPWIFSWRGAVLFFILMLAGNHRPLRHLEFLPEIAKWVEARPAGSVVASHEDFYAVAMMAAPQAAQQLKWSLFRRQDLPDDAEVLLPASLDNASALMLHRPRMLVTARKRFESKRTLDLADLAENMLDLDRSWRLADATLRLQEPEFYWFTRRAGPVREISVLGALQKLDWSVKPPTLKDMFRDIGTGTVVPQDPAGLTFRREKKGLLQFIAPPVAIPENWRDQIYNLRCEIESDKIRPLEFILRFQDANGKILSTQILDPYATRRGLLDFQAVRIPAAAVTCRVSVMVDSGAGYFTIRRASVFQDADATP